MTAQELLAALSGAGASLSARDGKLKFDGPAELLQLHKEAIAALRPQLLELLAPPCCCETVGGWLYRCEQHQNTPTGKVLVEPAPPGDEFTDLVEKAVALFGGRALGGRP